MNLPVPTPDEVKSFNPVYCEVYGREPTDEAALEAATFWLQLFYLVNYGQQHRE